MKEKLKFAGTVFLALCIGYLAFSIFYFTNEANKWRQELPGLLKQTEKTAEKISPAATGISEVTELVPSILEEVSEARKVIKDLLGEVKTTREAVPDILKEAQPISEQVGKTTDELPGIINPLIREVEKVRESIPGILEEVKKTNDTVKKALVEIQETRDEIPRIMEHVEEIRKEMPIWLETIDNASDAILKASKEIEELRPLIPDIVEEVKKTREEMPALLDQAEHMVGEAGKIGAEAGKGAVGGVVTGILSAPFSIMKGLEESITNIPKVSGGEKLHEKDIAIIKEKIVKVAETGKVGQTLDWNNPETKRYGKITFIKKYRKKNHECCNIRYEIWSKGKNIHTETVSGCKQPDGSWDKK